MTLKTLYKLTQNIIREREQKKQLENNNQDNHQDNYQNNNKSVTKTFQNSVYTKIN